MVTGGLGGMGGAQPLAVTMNEGVCLVCGSGSNIASSRRHGRQPATSTSGPTTRSTTALEWALTTTKEARGNRYQSVCCMQPGRPDVLNRLAQEQDHSPTWSPIRPPHTIRSMEGYVPNGMLQGRARPSKPYGAGRTPILERTASTRRMLNGSAKCDP